MLLPLSKETLLTPSTVSEDISHTVSFVLPACLLNHDAEGSKQDDDGDATNDSYEFYVADTVTTNWKVGLHRWEVQHQDTGTTPTTKRLIAVGTIEVKTKPSAI